MGYEMRLVDQLEEIIMSFERSLQDFVSVFVEKVQELLVGFCLFILLYKA